MNNLSDVKLEDLGYLPRIAFNMDHYFKKACAHGKQCLTMCILFAIKDNPKGHTINLYFRTSTL